MHAAASNRHCPTVMLRTKALILHATIERHCAAGCGQPQNCSFAVPSDALQAICNDCVTHPAGHGADGILWTWSAAGGRINLWQCRSARGRRTVREEKPKPDPGNGIHAFDIWGRHEGKEVCG